MCDWLTLTARGPPPPLWQTSFYQRFLKAAKNMLSQSFMRGTVIVPKAVSLRWQCGHSFSMSPV